MRLDHLKDMVFTQWLTGGGLPVDFVLKFVLSSTIWCFDKGSLTLQSNQTYPQKHLYHFILRCLDSIVLFFLILCPLHS